MKRFFNSFAIIQILKLVFFLFLETMIGKLTFYKIAEMSLHASVMFF